MEKPKLFRFIKALKSYPVTVAYYVNMPVAVSFYFSLVHYNLFSRREPTSGAYNETDFCFTKFTFNLY